MAQQSLKFCAWLCAAALRYALRCHARLGVARRDKDANGVKEGTKVLTSVEIVTFICMTLISVLVGLKLRYSAKAHEREAKRFDAQVRKAMPQ